MFVSYPTNCIHWNKHPWMFKFQTLAPFLKGPMGTYLGGRLFQQIQYHIYQQQKMIIKTNTLRKFLKYLTELNVS